LRIEQKMGEPCRREGIASQAYRKQYGAKADHDDAPNKAEGNEVIGSKDQAAPEPDRGIVPADATKPGTARPITGLKAYRILKSRIELSV
jgi:hypothetical protein